LPSAAGVNPSGWKKRKGLMDAVLDYLRSLRVEPVSYGTGLVGRVRALAPGGVDPALDVAGSGVLPELIELAGGPEHVVTIADFAGAQEARDEVQWPARPGEVAGPGR
jgi:hypothetical protein